MKSAAFQEILVGKFTVCKDLSGHEARLARLSVKHVRKLRIKYGFNGRDEEKSSISDRLNFQTILYYISTVDLNEKQRDRLVDALIDRGIITEQATSIVEHPEEPKEEARLLLPFLQEFWDYEKSPYVKEKLAYGQSIGKRHCYEQSSRINHWEGYFSPETRITDITKETLKDFQLALKDKKLAPKTINMILTVGTVPFKWVADRGELETNPAVGLRKFAGESKKRDIPSCVRRAFH